MSDQCQIGELDRCKFKNNDKKSQYICLSPLCLQRFKIMCELCSSSQLHQNHIVVNIESIFQQRKSTINNEIKYFALNIFQLIELKQQQNDKLQHCIDTIQYYKNQMVESINQQIDIQTQLIQEMFRLESITSNYYDKQLHLSEKLIEIQIKKLLSQTHICPKFEITNLIQQAQNNFQTFSSRLNKKEELEEIHQCITKSFQQRNFETKQDQDLLDRIRLITDFDQYENLQYEIQENKNPISMRYQPKNRQLDSQLSSFSDSLIPYIKQSNDLPLFDQLLPSKLFYDNNFRVVMNKYFCQGESLVSLYFRQTDERFFKTPPFLQDLSFTNLLNLSVNINSLDFKNLINFVQNHPKIQSLDILLNADQQLLAISNMRSLFSSQALPNIQKLKIDITRLNFSSSIQINDFQDFFQPIQSFLSEKRNSIQSFEIDGLIEFNYSIEELQSLFYNQQNQIMTHLRNLTFLVTDIDLQYDQQKILLNDLHQNIFSQMPLLQQIKLYKISEYLDIQGFFQMLNWQLKIKTYLIKLLMRIKSRLKFFRKEIIYAIIEDYIKTISSMIKINTF
ncbi:hypothetical protein ABPG72_011331 [Tetrahymena utriculariae]